MQIKKIVFYNLLSLFLISIPFEIFLQFKLNFDDNFYGMSSKTIPGTINIHPYGQIPINQRGFYDQDWENDKSKKRYGYTGDSVAYGVGAGFPFRITEYLDKLKPEIEHVNISSGINTNILNLGNASTIRELILKNKIDKLIYLLNLNDIAPLAYKFKKNETSIKEYRQSPLRRLKTFIYPLDKRLRGRSKLYTYIRFQFKNILVTVFNRNISGFKAIELQPEENLNDIKLAANNLSKLLENINLKSTNICVLILPYEMQISEDARKTYEELNIDFSKSFLDFKTQKLFIEEFEKESLIEINYLGLNFKEKPVGTYYVFNKGDKIDFNHPNRIGHKVLAEEISQNNYCL